MLTVVYREKLPQWSGWGSVQEIQVESLEDFLRVYKLTFGQDSITPFICVSRDNCEGLRPYKTLEHVRLTNADGTPVRCRVNRRVKLWKTRPREFKLPVKYGLRECFYITQDNGSDWRVS